MKINCCQYHSVYDHSIINWCVFAEKQRLETGMQKKYFATQLDFLKENFLWTSAVKCDNMWLFKNHFYGIRRHLSKMMCTFIIVVFWKSEILFLDLKHWLTLSHPVNVMDQTEMNLSTAFHMHFYAASLHHSKYAAVMQCLSATMYIIVILCY